MEFSRTEIASGVWFNHVPVRDPSACCLSISMLSQLDRETSGLNALIPHVLCAGTSFCPSAAALASRMKALGVTALEPVVRGFGEVQAVGIRVTFAPGGDLSDVCRFAAEVLLSPATKGGLFLPQNVDREKAALAARLDGLEEDPAAYALQRCREEMCCFEDYCVSPLGDAETVENAHYKNFTKYYHTFLQTSPIEIVCCAPGKARVPESALRDAMAAMPRGDINYDLGTDVRMNSVEESARSLTEDSPAKLSVLAAGYRLGDSMEDPDLAALLLMRELLEAALRKSDSGACADLDIHKGVLLLSVRSDAEGPAAPEDNDAEQDMPASLRETLERRIDAAVDYVRGDSLTKAEFTAVKEQLAARLGAASKDSEQLEAFALSQILFGLGFGPEELAELVRDLSGPEVAAAIACLEKDFVFLLNGVGA